MCGKEGVSGGIAANLLATPYSRCPAVTSTLTPHPPHLSQWHSVQFKLVVTSMSSTEDHGRSQRKDTLDPIPTSLEWKWD